MKKNKIIWLLVILVTFSNTIFCDFIEEIKQNLQPEYLNPLAKDITGITCMNMFTNAEGLGLFKTIPPSIGLNFRLYLGLKKISSENIILSKLGEKQGYDFIGLPVVQLEKGLPFNIDFIVRGMGVSGMTFYGFGVKYCVFDSIIPGVPDISIAGVMNKFIATDVLSLDSTSLNIIASVGLPVIKPYLIVGIDNGNMEINDKLLEELGLSSLGKLTGKFSSGTRIELGINFSFFPVVYINLAYSKIYNEDGASVSIGLSF